MIVQCPSCSARYRVNEQNIPATGGRISCPQCQHTFIVYPESSAQAPAHQPKPASYDGEKTSVATDINTLMAGMGGGGQQGGGDDLATEVISGDALASFGNFGAPSFEPPGEDGTVEMKNPLSFIKQNQDLFGGDSVGDMMTEVTMDESSLKTEVASGMDFEHMLSSQNTPAPTQPPAFSGGPAFSTGPRPVIPAKVATGAYQAGSPQSFGQPAAPQPPSQPVAPPVPASPPPQPAAPAGANPNHAGPWKLKTDFGLTYEFQDTKSLISWMSGRESLDNYELSAGDEHFFAWSAFPQIGEQLSSGGLGAQPSAAYQTGQQQAVAPAFPVGASQSGAELSEPSGLTGAPMFGVPDAQPPAAAPLADPFGSMSAGSTPSPTGANRAVVNDVGYSPPSRDAKWNVLLWGLFIVLALGCLALAAQIFGVVDFKTMLGLAPTTQTQPATPVVTTDKPAPDSEAEDGPAVADKVEKATDKAADAPSEKDREMATTMIAEARAEIEANHLTTAREKLESALLLDPKRAEVYLLLAKVYENLGQPDKAKEMRDTMQTLNTDMKMDDGAPLIP